MNDVETAIYQKLITTSALTSLLTDGASGIFNQHVSAGANWPLVVFNLQGGGDENKSPHRSLNVLYFIRATSNVSLEQAGNIAAAIDAALHLQSLTVSGWSNIWLAREGPVRTVETTPEGEKFYHAGATYRVRLAQ